MSTRLERKATSCTTDADGYGVIQHGLGVAPDEILLTPRIPAGQKHFSVSVVTSSYTTSQFKVRAVNHDGTPRANMKTFITYQATAEVSVEPGPEDPQDPQDPGEPEEPEQPTNPLVCTNPQFTWSTRSGGGAVHADGVGDGKQYYGSPNLWNDNGTVTMTMGVCSHRSWYVRATAKNLGDGAVLCYPNMHKDWINWSNRQMPLLSNYSRLPLRWQHDGPGNVGIWNWAVDAWINGVGNDNGVTELMIWTEYKTQRPAGSNRGRVTVGGREWDLWTTGSNDIVSYVAVQPLKSGSMDVKHFTDHLISTGRMRSDSRLGQIGYGVEIVDTGGAERRFDVLDLQIDGF